MVAQASDLGAEAVAAVATAGVRMAANGAAFVEAVRERTGIEIEVISGEEEARLAYVAATSTLPVAGSSLAVFDTGGGSSQFSFGSRERVDERFSVNVGAARFTEQFHLDETVDDVRLAAAGDAIAAELGVLDGRPSPDTLIGLGGATPTSRRSGTALRDYDPEVVHGTVLDRPEIDRQIELYRSRPAKDRRSIVGLQADRAPVILPAP